MLAITSLAAVLVALSVFVHYETLRLCNELLPRLRCIEGRTQLLAAIGAAFCSHLGHITLFAVAFAFLDGTSLGRLQGAFSHTAAAFLYFSAETYTSLGFGDVYPAGAMRLIAGIEALTGLLMIGWTTSFTYLEMSRHWTSTPR
jgi:hypothetical protein